MHFINKPFVVLTAALETTWTKPDNHLHQPDFKIHQRAYSFLFEAMSHNISQFIGSSIVWKTSARIKNVLFHKRTKVIQFQRKRANKWYFFFFFGNKLDFKSQFVMDLKNKNIANSSLNAIKWHIMTQNNSCSEW